MSVNFVAVVVAFEAWWWRLGRSFALGTTVVPVVFVTSERGIIQLLFLVWGPSKGTRCVWIKRRASHSSCFFHAFSPSFFSFFLFFLSHNTKKTKNKRKKKRVGAQIVLFCVRRLLFVMSLLRAFAMLPVLLLALVDENEAAMKRLPGFTYRANEEEGGEKMNGATTPTKHAPLEGQTFIEGCRELCEEDESPPICVKNVSYANECWFMCRNNEALEGIELTRGACAEGALFAIAKRACAQACDLKFEPVCGETGETFSNECIAKCAKVRYTTNGSC